MTDRDPQPIDVPDDPAVMTVILLGLTATLREALAAIGADTDGATKLAELHQRLIHGAKNMAVLQGLPLDQEVEAIRALVSLIDAARPRQ